MSRYASTPSLFPLHGGCACAHVRYSLTTAPLAVHACHCPLCQRESGSAFIINAVIETENLLLQPSAAAPTLPGTSTPLGPPLPTSPFGAVESDQGVNNTVAVPTPTASHAPQTIHRCPRCGVAVWSFYGASAGPIVYVRAGTLDNPGALEPDAHIYVKSKRGFVALGEETPRFEEHYQPGDVYRAEAMGRLQAVIEKRARA
ncbi:hypothetical protein ACHAQH_000327 [Verticillium albo-atrum]